MNLIILDYSSLLEYEMQRIKFEHSLLYIKPAIKCTRDEVVYDVNCIHSSTLSTSFEVNRFYYIIIVN